MFTVDRLCSILGIQHPLNHATCVGYGKRKPDCGMPVAAASRNAALAELKHISNALGQARINDSSLRETLENAAHLLHCKRWHQYQAESKADEWFRSLTNYIANRPERSRQQPHRFAPQSAATTITTFAAGSHGRTPSTTASSQPLVRSVRDTSYNGILEELASLIQSQTQMLETIVRNTSAHRGRTTLEQEGITDTVPDFDSESNLRSDTHAGSGFQNDNDLHDGADPEDSGSDDENPVPQRSMSSARSYASYSSSSRSSPTISSSSFGSASRSIRTSSPSSSSISRRTRTPSPSSHSSTSDSACGICLSELPRRDESIWRCTTCRNATHVDCFEAWMAASPGNSIRCIYCRSDVVS